MPKTDRCWDYLHAAGRELSKGGDIDAVVARLRRDFELPRTSNEEDVHVFLEGLADARENENIEVEGEPILSEPAKAAE
jgi:hypothetical protein